MKYRQALRAHTHERTNKQHNLCCLKTDEPSGTISRLLWPFVEKKPRAFRRFNCSVHAVYKPGSDLSQSGANGNSGEYFGLWLVHRLTVWLLFFLSFHCLLPTSSLFGHSGRGAVVGLYPPCWPPLIG